jgi:choline kinase
MRALILAAGRTTGMGEHHDQRPKGLVPLAGKPLLDRQIAALRAGGVTEIGIVRGYRGDTIDRPETTRFENPRWQETGAVTSLATAADWLRTAPVIVSTDDVFYSHDIVHRLGSVRGTLAIAYDRQWRELWDRRFANPLAHATTFRRSSSGNLLAIGGRPGDLKEIDGQFMGLLKFTPVAWQAVEALLTKLDPAAADGLDIVAMLQHLLADRPIPIGVVGADGQWGRIDRTDDIALYESMARDNQLTFEG